ncbi:MAG: hypothetical protein IJD64_05150 [Clostridia bacterium]|nr:hypothetical protein [Clostridia bacterium]
MLVTCIKCKKSISANKKICSYCGASQDGITTRNDITKGNHPVEHFNPDNIRELYSDNNAKKCTIYPYAIQFKGGGLCLFLIPISENDDLFCNKNITVEDEIERIILREPKWYYAKHEKTKSYYFYSINDMNLAEYGFSNFPLFFIPYSIIMQPKYFVDTITKIKLFSYEHFKGIESETNFYSIPSLELAKMARNGYDNFYFLNS